MAIADGQRQHNRAKVYAGHYISKKTNRKCPLVLVVKCGNSQEEKNDSKPGNRGKRDSQVIFMNFFSKVMFDDRMSPLEYDLFRKIHRINGVTPDFYG